MSRISGYGNPFYRTTFVNGQILRSTGQSYSAMLMSNLSTKNPRLARNLFSNLINTRTNSATSTVKNALENYDKKISESVKTSDDAKKMLAVQMTQTPLYTGKSSIQTDYYSTLGNLFNYLL